MNYERENVRRMVGYVYGEQPADPSVVKLNTNENPYPPSPAVREAMNAFDADSLRRYPPATAAPLRRLVAERLDLSVEQVVATNGGDEALRLAITTFVDPGATLGVAVPGYSLSPVLAKVQDCAMVAVPLAPDWSLPADFAKRLNAAGAKLACVVNPHAPSGTLVALETVSALAAELDGVLLVDEAYVDFVDPELGHDLTPLLSDHDNVLLLRTLSKSYSLAGLRVAFLARVSHQAASRRQKSSWFQEVDRDANDRAGCRLRWPCPRGSFGPVYTRARARTCSLNRRPRYALGREHAHRAKILRDHHGPW